VRKFVLCVLASIAVLAAAIVDKAATAPNQRAHLTTDAGVAANDAAANDAAAKSSTGSGTVSGSSADVSAGTDTRTALGPAIPLAHGLVQVEVTAMGSRIVDVEAVQLPHDNNHSWEDSQHAAAVLRSEILSKQTTDLDVVSGATYTSEGYLESLNAALDLAAPAAPKMIPTPLA
jgi:uncharacterized protein with FMN-binding domain